MALLAVLQAPDQMASRPSDSVRVIDAPTVNDADPDDPVVTLMPAGWDETTTPFRPDAVTDKVAVWAADGDTVSDAVRLTEFAAAVTVTTVAVVTLLVLTENDAAVAPDGTTTLLGTLPIAGLLLDSATSSPPAGAAADSVTTPTALAPPTTFDGDSVIPCRLTDGGADAGVTVSVVVRTEPL